VNYLGDFTSGEWLRLSPDDNRYSPQEAPRPKRACEEKTRGGEPRKRCVRG